MMRAMGGIVRNAVLLGLLLGLTAGAFYLDFYNPVLVHGQEPTATVTVEVPSDAVGDPAPDDDDDLRSWLIIIGSFVIGAGLFLTQAEKLGQFASSIWALGANILAMFLGAEQVRAQSRWIAYQRECDEYKGRIADLERRMERAINEPRKYGQLKGRLDTLEDDFETFRANSPWKHEE